MELVQTILRVVLIFLIVFIERKKPGEALLWVVLVFVFPILGGILYLAFGSTLGIKITHHFRNKRAHDSYLLALGEQYTQLKDGSLLDSFFDDERQLAAFNLNYCEGGIGFHNEVDIFTNGKTKYAQLFEDCNKATHHIHVAYYGIYKDRIGEEFLQVLVKKAHEGVQVKVLCDGIGSFAIKSRLFGPLIAAGGQVKTIKPLLSHFRYHRKIVVVDGKLGWTGGMNIGCKYVDEHPVKTPWRDTQIRLQGEAVYLLQYYFMYDWLFATRKVDVPEYFEDENLAFPPTGIMQALPCQVIGSGVETDKQPIKLSYLRMFSLARKKIVLQTPYFIPSISLLEALKVALSSGVEVELQISSKSSNFFLDPVTRYYCAQLIPLGMKVYLYAGYLHAKTVRVDDTITCIGSVNIDIRSLEVDDEICAVFYDEDFAVRYDVLLEEDRENSKELDYLRFMDRGLVQKAAERFFLLFSPLM